MAVGPFLLMIDFNSISFDFNFLYKCLIVSKFNKFQLSFSNRSANIGDFCFLLNCSSLSSGITKYFGTFESMFDPLTNPLVIDVENSTSKELIILLFFIQRRSI